MAEMPKPEELQKVLQGNRVAILNKQPQNEKLLRGERGCGNCYWNPTGEICQLEPLKSNALPQQGPQPGTVQFFNFAIPQKVPPEYVCSHHQYDIEVEPLRRRDVTRQQILAAQTKAAEGAE